MKSKPKLLSGVRLYVRRETSDDEVSIEEYEQMQELLRHPSAGRLIKLALKKYFDELPDLLIRQQEEEIERIKRITKK